MWRAVRLAEKSIGLASPNPAVGCVIVKGGEVVGQGWHEYLHRDHAEVCALAMAGGRARGAAAYVTLEPCTHHGRTPPCVSALISAGVQRVVVGHMDPNPMVSGKGIQELLSAGVAVEVGLLQTEVGRVIEPFACHVTTGLPLVVGKVGMSMDGRIAAAGNSRDRITSEEGCHFGQQLRLRLDALLVGIGTILADDPKLSYRGELPKAQPLRTVILDGMLRTPTGACLFQTGAAPHVLIFCRQDAPKDRWQELEGRGAEVVPVEHSPAGLLDLKCVLRELGDRKILGVLVEGGSEVHWSFLSAQLVDKFYFIVAPMILGGRNSVPSVGGMGYPSAGDAPRLKISRSIAAGPDLILETYPCYSRSILSPWHPSATIAGTAARPVPGPGNDE
jgi:diaminohydroxyphosphoribosylaminopyrimidine deaminase/5-amino-6-(5-phosphoribosylamino)uracil reductase